MIINRFHGDYRFLSNFWPAKVKLDGITYPTVEHAYQAAKTTDARHREAIRAAISPGFAKRIGKLLVLRPDWEQVRLDIMYDLVSQKFRNDADLKDRLLGTGGAWLIEGNTWGDTFWGVCNGIGKNHLGKILMDVRGELSDAR